MKVRLKTRYAGPRGCFEPDTVIDVSNDEGKALVSGGYGIEVSGAAAKAPPHKPAHTAQKSEPADADGSDNGTAVVRGGGSKAESEEPAKAKTDDAKKAEPADRKKSI